MVHESYYLDTANDDRRISWSVAKSFLSALTGILVAEGAIPSLDVAVTDYAPALAGSAYDGATLRDVLQMSSGSHSTRTTWTSGPTSTAWAASSRSAVDGRLCRGSHRPRRGPR